MARVVVADDARLDLGRLETTHNLPPSVEDRFAQGIARLAVFPESGVPLRGRYAGRRFVLGPWRWMIVVYRYYPERDLVSILRIFDGRTPPTASR